MLARYICKVLRPVPPPPAHIQHTTRRLLSSLDTLDTWPDGTPKKFQGKEAWKNWINYNTDHNNLTDELNRLRHFFWEVDAHGKLWRLEIDALDTEGNMVGTPRRCGQMREVKILDFFFPQLKTNDSEMYSKDFPFLVRRAHEMYYCRTTWDPNGVQSYPVVFNNLEEDNTLLRHSCPGSGHIVRRVDTPFNPAKLRMDQGGRLFHPIASTSKVSLTGTVKPLHSENIDRWGLLESVVAQTIATEIGDMQVNESSEEMTLVFDGVVYPVGLMEDEL